MNHQLNCKSSQKQSTISCQRLPYGFGQLVRAGGAFKAAADAFQLGDDIFCLHAFHQSGDTLCVAVAAAVKLHVFHDAILNLKFYSLTAGALGSVSIIHDLLFQISRFIILVVALRR